MQTTESQTDLYADLAVFEEGMEEIRRLAQLEVLAKVV